jgi:Arsenical pump membrane protein
MFIVVRAIEDTGLTTIFGNWLIHLSGDTSFGAVMIGMAGAAVGTNLINNVPMAVVMVSALGGIQHAPPAIQHGFIAATIFGCDLGPNLTTVGSLATVLWLLISLFKFSECFAHFTAILSSIQAISAHAAPARQMDGDCDVVSLVVDFGLEQLYRPRSTAPNATHRFSFNEKCMRREQTSASIFPGSSGRGREAKR